MDAGAGCHQVAARFIDSAQAMRSAATSPVNTATSLTVTHMPSLDHLRGLWAQDVRMHASLRQLGGRHVHVRILVQRPQRRS